MSLAQAVAITAKLNEIRKCVQDLYGASWLDRLKPYMDELERIHKASGVPYLELGQEVARALQTQGVNPMMTLAAMVELIDPTPLT